MNFNEIKKGQFILYYDDEIRYVYEKTNSGMTMLTTGDGYGKMELLFFTGEEFDAYDAGSVSPYKPTSRNEMIAVRHEFIRDVFDRGIYTE